MMHTTKIGKRIPLEDLSNDHLHNIIRRMLKRSKDGVKIRKVAGYSHEDYYYEEEILFFGDALEAMNYDVYKSEFDRRKQGK